MLAWVVWSFILLLLLKFFKFLNGYFNSRVLIKFIGVLEGVDKAYINSNCLKKLKKKDTPKLLVWLVVYWLYLIVFFNVFWLFLTYYVLRILNLGDWDELTSIKIENIEDHFFINLFLVLPNAFAYQLLVIIIDIFNKRRFFTPQKLILALVMRLVFGFPAILTQFIELILNRNWSGGLGGFLWVFF